MLDSPIPALLSNTRACFVRSVTITSGQTISALTSERNRSGYQGPRGREYTMICRPGLGNSAIPVNFRFHSLSESRYKVYVCSKMAANAD